MLLAAGRADTIFKHSKSLLLHSHTGSMGFRTAEEVCCSGLAAAAVQLHYFTDQHLLDTGHSANTVLDNHGSLYCGIDHPL
jgi:hypothetical protein